jgi:flagellar biogenesis protein FliO
MFDSWQGQKSFSHVQASTDRTISFLSSGYCKIFPWGIKLIKVLHLVSMLYMYVCKLRSVVARNYVTFKVITAIQNLSLGSQPPL